MKKKCNEIVEIQNKEIEVKNESDTEEINDCVMTEENKYEKCHL